MNDLDNTYICPDAASRRATDESRPDINPLTIPDADLGWQRLLGILGFIAVIILLVYAADYLARLYPEESTVYGPTYQAFDHSVPDNLETILPDLRTSFFDTSEEHNHLTGSVARYRLLDVEGETYVVLLFSPTAYPYSTSQKTVQREDVYLVLFSKYTDVYPDILVLSEDSEIPSLPLTLETDGAYFVFPDYDYSAQNKNAL